MVCPIVPEDQILVKRHSEGMRERMGILNDNLEIRAIIKAAGNHVLFRIGPVQPVGQVVQRQSVGPLDNGTFEKDHWVGTIHVSATNVWVLLVPIRIEKVTMQWMHS